ncbi:MAG TPA: polyhydroxyalkanoic acid system family protein [Kofleriaceae bacterium]|nr:polyhydroxyalkanoic acid system family protein [Kofleriaceae bacterium]
MEIDFPYELSDQDARGRLDILGRYLANKHGIKVTWIDPVKAKFTGKYLVVKIDGELTLGNGRARFRGEDPGFLWRNRAKEYIQAKLAKYLDPKNAPDQLPTS